LLKVVADVGANLDLQDELGCTALMWIPVHGVTEVCKVLADAGFNFDLQVTVY
jgi:ankyrin repeat protein